MSKGIELIAIERQKQIDKHGFTAEHHAVTNPQWYNELQLQEAAHILLEVESFPVAEKDVRIPEGWDEKWFLNLYRRSREERLVIAGALLAAEIDRIEYMLGNKSISLLEEIKNLKELKQELEAKILQYYKDMAKPEMFAKLFGITSKREGEINQEPEEKIEYIIQATKNGKDWIAQANFKKGQNSRWNIPFNETIAIKEANSFLEHRHNEGFVGVRVVVII